MERAVADLTHDHWWQADNPDSLEVLEVQLAVLARNLELLRRRGGVYRELDKASYLLLRTLEAIGPSDITTLATALGLDPSTAGRQVTALREHGLVKRTADRQDRRRGIVSATAEGRRRLAHTRQGRRERTEELLAGWTQEEMRSLGGLLEKYNRAVARDYLLEPPSQLNQRVTQQT